MEWVTRWKLHTQMTQLCMLRHRQHILCCTYMFWYPWMTQQDSCRSERLDCKLCTPCKSLRRRRIRRYTRQLKVGNIRQRLLHVRSCVSPIQKSCTDQVRSLSQRMQLRPSIFGHCHCLSSPDHMPSHQQDPAVCTQQPHLSRPKNHHIWFPTRYRERSRQNHTDHSGCRVEWLHCLMLLLRSRAMSTYSGRMHHHCPLCSCSRTRW
mmetsp:Transcript_9218/g.19810  ORF Transcript_9218/g.19810 Transcript_9218/m.19810 type:complete len:207 (-) Transcript_9218:21-641(-)